ncbi:hypothetical protein [Stigmatella hybrida]|uniref:hypothetical protein n=1 Tax=Stigmatella hybrida TaxID=394097 RepID=UPI001CDAFADA|nr:hypothetical protein [Stigmatella hybrida]
MSETLYGIPVKRIDGPQAQLAEYTGKVLLVVEVLGFPANNFLTQEPGTDAEIQSFCNTQYDAERFSPDVAEDDPRLLAAIDRELAKTA